MKIFKLLVFLLIFPVLMTEATTPTLVTYVKFEGGEARNKYGSTTTLKSGWYEFVRDELIYTYVKYNQKEYRIMKSDTHTRRKKASKYSGYYKN